MAPARGFILSHIAVTARGGFRVLIPLPLEKREWELAFRCPVKNVGHGQVRGISEAGTGF